LIFCIIIISIAFVLIKILTAYSVAFPSEIYYLFVLIIPTTLLEFNCAALRSANYINLALVFQSIIAPFFNIAAILLFDVSIQHLPILYISSYFVAFLLSELFVLRLIFQNRFYYFGANYAEPLDADENLTISKLWKSSKFIYTTTIFVGLMELDTYFVDRWVSLKDAGIYIVAKKTALIVTFLLLVVNNVITPKLATQIAQNDKVGLQNTLKGSFGLLMVYGTLTTLICFIFAKEILVFFGINSIEGVLILRILLIGQFINIITGPVGNILNTSGNEVVLRNIIVVSSIVFLLMYPIFAPQFGIVGIATITSLRVILFNLIASYFAYKLFIKTNL
jgi:O-antigen/teichoic acid export membrane protein